MSVGRAGAHRREFGQQNKTFHTSKMRSKSQPLSAVEKPAIVIFHPTAPYLIGGVATLIRQRIDHFTKQGIPVYVVHQGDRFAWRNRRTTYNGAKLIGIPLPKVGIAVGRALIGRGRPASVEQVQKYVRPILLDIQREAGSIGVVVVDNMHGEYMESVAEGIAKSAGSLGLPTSHIAHNIWAPNRRFGHTYFPSHFGQQRVVSSAIADEYVRRGALGPSVDVGRPSVDCDEFHPDGPTRASMANRPGLRVFLPGRLAPDKGPEYLIRAIAILHRQGVPVSLTLCDPPNGSSAFKTQLIALAKAEGVGDCVHFETLKPADMPDACRSADIVCIPSQIPEGATASMEGLPVCELEAFASGVPVVATYGGGQEEAVRMAYGDLAEQALVDSRRPEAMAEALLRLSNNAELRHQFGEAGLEAARNVFSLKAALTDLQWDLARLDQRLAPPVSEVHPLVRQLPQAVRWLVEVEGGAEVLRRLASDASRSSVWPRWSSKRNGPSPTVAAKYAECIYAAQQEHPSLRTFSVGEAFGSLCNFSRNNPQRIDVRRRVNQILTELNRGVRGWSAGGYNAELATYRRLVDGVRGGGKSQLVLDASTTAAMPTSLRWLTELPGGVDVLGAILRADLARKYGEQITDAFGVHRSRVEVNTARAAFNVARSTALDLGIEVPESAGKPVEFDVALSDASAHAAELHLTLRAARQSTRARTQAPNSGLVA